MIAQTARRLRAQIDEFSGNLSWGLSKPLRRFVTEALQGIVGRQSVLLSEIARSLNEPIALIKTENRLSRHLGAERMRSVLQGAVSQLRSAMSEPTCELPVWRYRQGRTQEAPDRIVVEEPLEIRLAGEPFQMLMRLPGLEKELALGFLFTEGIVHDLSEVITLHFCGTATDPLLPPNVVDVRLAEAALNRRGRRHLEVSYSSCGLCAKEAVDEICRKVSPVSSTLTLSLDRLLALMDRLPSAQTVFQATGGTLTKLASASW